LRFDWSQSTTSIPQFSQAEYSLLILNELPLCLLDKDQTWNDYSFVLPSYWKNEKYRAYFLTAKEQGRFIILDNGLFEGDTFTSDYLIELINELKPNI